MQTVIKDETYLESLCFELNFGSQDRMGFLNIQKTTIECY
jgi:hypothetical protein